ncbi:cullin-9 isoform X2 [Hemibagrus wyckioides]|uniref:cullin-9 isoform X2 n=1 Tax=Hemibagrus wyckioides TaxID=337641 RepID=UPI00266CBB7C|nr:cullin-9 isoform X2 [Hemibagrus wyckioides]
MPYATCVKFWEFPPRLKTRWVRKSPQCRLLYFDTARNLILFSFLNMKRARKRKATITKICNKQRAKTSCSRGRKRRAEETDVKDPMMGGAASSQDDPPKQEIPTSMQTTESVTSILPMPLPQERDYSEMCPKCSSFLKPAVVPAGGSTSLLQCPKCSTTPLCESCLYPCPDGTCTNKSCPIVSLLLTCERVNKLESKVYGCPLFRACPNCHSIMMHERGCKYVFCAQCNHNYCFICLRTRQECTKDKNKYWSLTCSAPMAARQRFQT